MHFYFLVCYNLHIFKVNIFLGTQSINFIMFQRRRRKKGETHFNAMTGNAVERMKIGFSNRKNHFLVKISCNFFLLRSMSQSIC